MKKIQEADLIILQFPMYWLGVPAILKGWLERCLADKVAFNSETLQWFDSGPFKVSGCFFNSISTYTWVKVFRIIPEFRILRMT